MDRGGSEVVSVLAFYSNDSSLNPNTVYSFMCTFFEKSENKQKEAGDGPFKTLLASEGGGGCYSRMNGIFSVGVLALIRASFQLPRQAIKIHQKRNWKNLY